MPIRPAGAVPPVPWRAVTTDPVYRRAVRVLLLDERDRTLLLRYRNPQGEIYWVPPGGGLEHGEDHVAAACRELAEEVGIEGVEIGELGWRRRVVVPWQGTTWDQDERWFVARCAAADVERGLDPDRRAFLASEGVSGVRWWTQDEIITAAGVHFAPEDLGERLRGLLGHGAA